MNASESTSEHAERPFISMWFGNFFEPFYSDADAVRRGIRDIAGLGFTSINLDSKPWEDLFARYRGETASQYVGMQELMMAEAARHGMDYTCLALYLCGDNLYPGIRDVPPVRGEQSVRPDGTPMGTYKYWSPVAQATMVEHVRGLLRLYGDGMRRSPDGRVIMQTMFDPIPKPSFDAEGRSHYLWWLSARYEGDVDRVNERYGICAATFDDLLPAQYWLRPDELDWVGCALPTAADVTERTADWHRWVDNQTYLGEVMVEYFATMREHWRASEPELFVEPVLHQWGYFFNPPGQRDWQTGQRALDVYRVAKHVDSALFITAPLNAENRPDASVLSVETSIARTANEGRAFTGGLYLGRHLNEDVYRTVPPAEAIATHVAGGARRLHVYGYSGLDDGGVLFRMDAVFKDSLRTGTAWAAQVMPLLQQPRIREVALLFPASMSFYEPLELDEGGRHRMDLLGWYQQLTDLGWHVDIVHPDQVVAGALHDYRHLVVPTDSLYDVGETADLETAVRAFAESGGTVMHGSNSGLAKGAFDITDEPAPFDCVRWREDLIPHGWSTSAFASEGEVLGSYIESGRPGILRTRVGRGSVLSIGFEYGYAYSRRTMPIVPPAYGRGEMHPLVLLEQTPVDVEIGTSPSAPMRPMRGVEFAHFGDRGVIVNHRASPVDVSAISARRRIPLVPSAPGWLAAHSAEYIEF
ncbi:beta-galactosidase trimerization domain-containing protein [Humibacter sp. RRB41]|uniref:beta-galactosidase trimerization domain-containing protein n=1 Tax=Humibacter sp. RRB41 TaxID=2919946 RepID=UPI001FAAD202|nr:beta-galactosidase trimerization domain-containing protein [Humibacter sp. RRB41]